VGDLAFDGEPEDGRGRAARARDWPVDSDVALSPAAERFMARHVDSVGTLDLLTLLHDGGARDWTLPDLCAELRCPSAWAVRQLGRLALLDLVLQPEPGLHRFSSSGRHFAAVAEIVRAYRQQRGAVVRWVFAAPAPGAVAD
jgi:hypothetical protein